MPRMLISLEDVRLYGFHGVYLQENRVGADYLLSVRINCEIPTGTITDELSDTISYADVYTLVREQFAIQSKLLENVVWRIATSLLQKWQSVISVELKVVKVSPPIPNFQGNASVQLSLSREDLKN